MHKAFRIGLAAYALAGVLMCAAAGVAAWIGVDAERKSLEEVCPPLGCEPATDSR